MNQKAKNIIRECKTHGQSRFILEGRGFYRCTKCRSGAVSKRRRKVKLLAIKYLGGHCKHCGYNKCPGAMDFHHINGQKEFDVSGNGATVSWERIKKELDKCILLCANCHREEHYIGEEK